MARRAKVLGSDETVIAWPVGVRRASGRTGSSRRCVAAVPAASMRRDARHVRGALSELLAACLLILKGYRILDRGYRSRRGEIDIIAVRGRRLAFVEVKYRRTRAEAETSISNVQALRIADSAEQWVWRNPAYRDHEIGLDAILVAPRCLPRHLPNALQPG